MANFYSDKAKVGKRTAARAVYAGVNCVIGSFTWGVTNANDPAGVLSATAAAGDVIYMVPIPHRASLTRVVAIAGRNGAAYTIGLSASNSMFMVLTSLSAGLSNAAIGLPYRVSVSDDATVQYDWLTATSVLAGTNSLSDTIQVIAEYVMDEPN